MKRDALCHPTLFALLLAGGSAPGQVSIEAIVAEDLHVSNQTTGSGTKSKTTRRSTKLGKSHSVGVPDAAIHVSTSVRSGVAKYTFSCQAQSANGSTTQPRYECSCTGAVLIVLRSAKPVKGTVVITYNGSAPNNDPWASRFSTQIGSTLFHPPYFQNSPHTRRTYRTTLDARGVQVGHRTILFPKPPSKQPFPARMAATVVVEFLPDAWFEPFGRDCGPKLAAEVNASKQMVFSVRNLTPGPGGSSAVFFGVSRRNVPIPNTSCLLFTDILVGRLLKNSSTGTARLTVPRPAGSHRAYAQALGFAGTAIRSSNALEITLR